MQDADRSIDEVAPTRPRWRRGWPGARELLAGLVVLSIAFVIGSLSVASALRARNQPPQNHQVTVTGSAQEQVKADTFEWDASVSSTQPTPADALNQLKHWTSEIDAALVHAGALNSEITVGPVSVQPNTGSNGNVATFTETVNIKVRTHRLSAMGPVVVVADALLERNVPFISQPPQYTFTGLKKLRPILTAEATADARRRAQAAIGLHEKLGKSQSIYVGPFSVDAPGSVNIGSGDYDTASLQKVVSVAVTATYSTSS
ncbi:MAG TPA: SIMPL domain-containing protein [Acidimicrobiales bacterium]|nr:SIMPL domain-containing protein [Acidimicrobiales bacterium]